MRGLTVLGVIVLAACNRAANTDRAHAETRHAQARALIAEHCAACHQVPGVAVATGRVGPSLAHIGSQQIIAGYFANSPSTLTDWIVHPQKLLPGNAMPEMGLSRDQAATIVDYLYTVE
jgi:cytochrome c